MELHGDTAAAYLDFAAYAEPDSPTLDAWARGVADDPDVLAWLAVLPEPKRQPNLVFAAARAHGVAAPGPYAGLRDALLGDGAAGGAIRRTIESRATQTNEVGRLATLVPAYAVVPGLPDGPPVALLEVGASAGLCLHPDRWAYRWHTPDGVVSAGRGAGPLECDVTVAEGAAAPVPVDPPRVAWRGGIDLNPLDLVDENTDGDLAWLRTLVWPEQTDRLAQLDEAVAVARADPPDLRRGDLLELLPALVEEAAAYGPVVVFHTAVIAYLEPDDREHFHELMTGLVADGACHWVSNEGKRVLPRLTATGPPVPDDLATFVTAVDGEAVAWTHGHGRSMTWFGRLAARGRS